MRGALTSGEIDMYWEYTGTAWLGPLGNTNPVAGEQAQFDAVKQADAANGITWFAMAGANNAYAIAANPAAAQEFGVSGSNAEQDIDDLGVKFVLRYRLFIP